MAQNILKKPMYRDFYFHVLKGVSMFAHRARGLSVADPNIDRFIAEALAVAVSPRSVALNGMPMLLSRALEMRDRARRLYECACEPFPNRQEALSGPATMTFFTQPETIPAQARGLGARKLTGGKAYDDYYWESVCIEKLGTLGAMAISSRNKAVDHDISGFLHKVLDFLANDLRAFELFALADKMDKVILKLANALAAGDTWVDVPSPRATNSVALPAGMKPPHTKPEPL